MSKDERPVNGRVTTAVEVLIYLLPEGRAMAAVLEKTWRGPFRLDRRLSRTVPIRERSVAPRGVEQHLWDAYVFLSQVIWERVDAAREADGH